MAIERVHDDMDSNRRQRLLKKGSIEDRVEALEYLVGKLLTPSKLSRLSKREREHLDRIKQADKDHPEEND